MPGAVKDLVDILGVRLEVVRVHAPFPIIVTVVYMLRRQAKVAQRSLRPKRAVLIEVFDKEIASLIEHRDGVKDAVADLIVVRMDLADVAAIQVDGMAQLVIVHAVVGVHGHAIRGFAQLGVGVRHTEAKRMGHLGIVVFEEYRAAVLQALDKVVFGGDGGEDGKLIAAKAKRRLADLDIELKVQAHLHDVAVAFVMAKGIVTVLEVVDVDKSHGDRRALFPDLFEGAGKAATVAQSRELVGKGDLNQLFLAVEQVLNGLFERFGIVAGVIHVYAASLGRGDAARWSCYVLGVGMGVSAVDGPCHFAKSMCRLLSCRRMPRGSIDALSAMSASNDSTGMGR